MPARYCRDSNRRFRGSLADRRETWWARSLWRPRFASRTRSASRPTFRGRRGSAVAPRARAHERPPIDRLDMSETGVAVWGGQCQAYRGACQPKRSESPANSESPDPSRLLTPSRLRTETGFRLAGDSDPPSPRGGPRLRGGGPRRMHGRDLLRGAPALRRWREGGSDAARGPRCRGGGGCFPLVDHCRAFDHDGCIRPFSRRHRAVCRL